MLVGSEPEEEGVAAFSSQVKRVSAVSNEHPRTPRHSEGKMVLSQVSQTFFFWPLEEGKSMISYCSSLEEVSYTGIEGIDAFGIETKKT